MLAAPRKIWNWQRPRATQAAMKSTNRPQLNLERRGRRINWMEGLLWSTPMAVDQLARPDAELQMILQVSSWRTSDNIGLITTSSSPSLLAADQWSEVDEWPTSERELSFSSHQKGLDVNNLKIEFEPLKLKNQPKAKSNYSLIVIKPVLTFFKT